ncbi:hypothetical protein DUNSADRAFT_11454 [Dunaliella salina]|uniref:Uncharacterized protein n=1 Tax=Dunaliella salina TaxID=3046 RepID=A0ABQ7GDC3_DUNSA|nr:hypothetical protein DUNSADRAFT_11454 [Dunaliella salina]|eukprot:KAF5832612.1 hypothetical protein DUNSADRAFT_11454 [Dunaliella salina]
MHSSCASQSHHDAAEPRSATEAAFPGQQGSSHAPPAAPKRTVIASFLGSIAMAPANAIASVNKDRVRALEQQGFHAGSSTGPLPFASSSLSNNVSSSSNNSPSTSAAAGNNGEGTTASTPLDASGSSDSKSQGTQGAEDNKKEKRGRLKVPEKTAAGLVQDQPGLLTHKEEILQGRLVGMAQLLEAATLEEAAALCKREPGLLAFTTEDLQSKLKNLPLRCPHLPTSGPLLS